MFTHVLGTADIVQAPGPTIHQHCSKSRRKNQNILITKKT